MGEQMIEKLITIIARVVDRVANEERGDVPGWVLVAVMTAGLVTAIWMVADTQLTNILTRAIESVSR